MIVDTPGMIDSPMVRDHFGGTNQKAVMDRGYDFEGVCKWYVIMLIMLIVLIMLIMLIMLVELWALCHGYLISLSFYACVSVMLIISRAGSYRVVHWRANACLLLSYPTISLAFNITNILISTITKT